VSKVGLMMLFLSRSVPLVPEFSPFMLDVCEVVDKSSKCVAKQIRQELEAPVQNRRNRTFRFQKPEPPILSGPTAVCGAARLRRGAPPSAKRCLDGGEA
jgi:hypothetical protein